ncbi:MAG TPA: Gfo/Idh/MocA family oxidoreductase [Candidatus Binatia bacterium]|nr:Gfo/Idh/MocA family oxidoreductase [Candidatus Binatia bacterium]
MNIIHVGLGIRGRHWLEIVRDYPAATSVACVDPQGEALDWVKRHFPALGQACYEDLGSAFTSIEADAAIISSPPALHATHAIMALEAGLAVMIEKPFATSVAEGARIVGVSRRTGRLIMVGQNYRYRRCEQTLQKLLREGKVGCVTHVSYVDRRARSPQGNFLSQVDYAQVLDVGAHHFDSLRSILGVNPVRVMGRCSKAPWSGYRHGSTTEANFEMENNIHIQYYGSLTSSRYESTLTIEGNKGVLRSDQRHVWWRKYGWRFFLPLPMAKIPPGDALKYPREGTTTLLDQLNAAVTQKRVPETNGDDNLWTLAMVEATMLSDKTETVVSVGDLLKSAGVSQVPLPEFPRTMTA